MHVGGPRLLEMLALELSPALQSFADAAGRKAQSVIFTVVDKNVVAAFAIADVIRPESRRAIQACTR